MAGCQVGMDDDRDRDRDRDRGQEQGQEQRVERGRRSASGLGFGGVGPEWCLGGG